MVTIGRVTTLVASDDILDSPLIRKSGYLLTIGEILGLHMG
jgi:hypothetical protein